MTRFGILITSLAVALCAAPPARAAFEPRDTAVSPPARTAEFTGSVNTGGDTNYVDILQGTTGGTHGLCAAPSCETGTLQVSGASAGKLHVVVKGTKGANNIALEVVKPDGSTAYANSSGTATVAQKRQLVLDAPADGTYTLRISGEGTSSSGGEMEFRGGAWLELPGGPAGSGSAFLDDVVCPAAQHFPYPALPAAAPGAPVNDPLFAQQWGLPQIKVPAAWKRGFTGKGVTIAMVDTGIDFDHPEFAGDRLLKGMNALDTPACARGARDDMGHGTATASLAAGGANDGVGIAGVAYEATILPIRVANDEGTYFNDQLIAGLRYAIDSGVDVINLSLGGSEADQVTYGASEDPHRLDPLIKEAWEKGIVVVAAGGNTHEPVCLFPARSPHALCVAATDRDGLPSDFSAMPNGDGVGNGVRAPGGADQKSQVNGCGELIVMAWWPGSGAGGNCDLGSKAYLAGWGTSMAAPLVTGLAAMLKQAGLTNEEIVARIRSTASNKGVSDPVMGYGLVDADAATAGLTPKPSTANRAVVKTPTAKRPSKACRAARAASLRATRRAAAARRALHRHRTRAARRTLARRLKARDRAVRLVARRCR
jgi:subtilisin family serine protease